MDYWRVRDLSRKFDVDEKAIYCLSNDAVLFLSYLDKKDRKRISLSFNDCSSEEDPEIVFVFKGAKMFREYFRLTGEYSGNYYVRGGRLSLGLEQFENYVSKKRKS